MGAFKGGLTVRRFRVEDDPPDGFRDAYLKALAARKAHPIRPEEDVDRASGWTVCGRLLDTDFDLAKVFWNDYLVVTHRTDSLRIPAALLEAHAQEREEMVIAERGEDNLSRQERSEIKELVRRELRRKMLPTMKAVDVVWSISRRRVWVWTQNQSALDEIQDLFLQTFGKNLLSEDPYSAADLAGWGERKGSPLNHVDPAEFAGGEGA